MAKGGPTEEANLATLCDGCHSLDHEGLLVLRGSVTGDLRFTDSNGRDLREPAEVHQQVLKVSARADTSDVVTFTELPAEVDAAWFDRHAHLFKWRNGTLDFSPGRPSGNETEPVQHPPAAH